MVLVEFHHDKVHVQTVEMAWEQGYTFTQAVTDNGFVCSCLFFLVLKRIHRIFGYSFVNVFVRLQTNIRTFIV